MRAAAGRCCQVLCRVFSRKVFKYCGLRRSSRGYWPQDGLGQRVIEELRKFVIAEPKWEV